MKQIIIICLILMLLLTGLCGCAAHNLTQTDISEYPERGRAVAEILDSGNFSGALPSDELVAEYGTEYYCKSEQALLGDMNFIIKVTLDITDVAVYDNQLDHLRSTAIGTKNVGNFTFYYMNKSADDNDADTYGFTDGEFLDGTYYDFEIAVAGQDLSITYLTARVWDYYENNEVLTAFLQSTLN